MDYYRNSVTEKSWQLLTNLRKNYSFILIGGWAVWLYTKKFKSKDIDIIINLSDLNKLKTEFDVYKNLRLKKYEARRGEVQIDVYTPHYSDIGFPIEKIQSHVHNLEDFQVPSTEMLAALKLVPWSKRLGSAKGRKDFLDIISLINLKGFDKNAFKNFTQSKQLMIATRKFHQEIRQTISIPELKLNKHQTARRKKHWLSLLD